MQHLEGSGTPVLYIGRTVLKGCTQHKMKRVFLLSDMPRNRNRMSAIVSVWDLELSWWQQTYRIFSNMGPSSLAKMYTFFEKNADLISALK